MDTIAFARGVPAPEMLPVDDLKTAARRAFDADSITGMLSYGTGAGWPPLRERLGTMCGVHADHVVITSGSLQGFALLCEVIARMARDEGRTARVIVERPTYDRPLLLLERLGIEAVPVSVDPANGVDLDELERAMVDGADLAYIIPTYQNPSGATVPEHHRRRIVELARTHDVLVLEDDPYGQLHFHDPAPASIHSMRGDAPIAFSGSFSKTVAPGLRVGWLALPAQLATSVATLANDTYISASFPAQAIIDEYLAANAFTPNVERARAMLRERCDILTDAIARHMPDARITPPAGGYFAWLQLPGDVDARRVATVAPDHGVSFVAGASFGPGWDDWVRLAFSSPPIDQLENGIVRLADACRTALAVR